MKARMFTVFALVVGLALVLTWAVAAQGPEPPVTSQRGEPPPQPIPAWNWDSETPFRQPVAPADVSAQAANSDIPLGQPGLSFRYVQTFGETEVAYNPDTSHLNYPYGIGTVGNFVWIGEKWGNRLLKYDSAGTFQKEFGRARFPDSYEDTSFWEIEDVAEDSAGNIWVLDSARNIVGKLNASGEKILELGTVWEEGDDNDHFVDPMSVAFDANGNIYVSDGGTWWNRERGNHRIQIFRSDGTYLATIGQTGVCGSGNNQLCGPRHIAIYGSELYVADAGNDRVQVFDITNPASPGYVATISGLNNPSGVAVDAEYIYVADTWNDQVQVFSRATRAHVATIGSGWGDGSDEFKNPTDVTVDTAGSLYVADFVNTRVQQFTRSDSTWTYMRTYGVTGVPYLTNGYHYNNPSGVAIASDGSIYLTEDNGHRLVKLSSDGTPIWTVGAAGVKGDWDNSNDRLDNPDDVALDASGRAYVADRWHGRVQIYNPDGSYYATVGGLDCPGGVAIGPNGYLYVANSCNHTVRIYNTGLVLIATLGTSGEAGADNAHFSSPEDVAVDGNGTIYVSDRDNHRVQVFNASYAYVRTMGETGVSGSDFNHFNGPNGLFVDANDRLYVADEWNNRIQVFDKDSNYLTTIGGSWGSRTGQFGGAHGVAVDSAGNVYVADYDNHRVQKFALGVPGWKQVNINGFGDRSSRIATLAPFGDHLYAGTFKFADHGAQLWRMDASGNWTAVMTNGFGVYYNVGIDHLVEFNGNLYAGVWNSTPYPPYTDTGGEIWRSSNGSTWTQVVSGGFGDRFNGEVFRLAVFNNQIYASAWSYTDTHGAEIWRSSTGNAGEWEQVVANGLGDATNQAGIAMEVFNGHIYIGTYSWNSATNRPNGCEIWRSDGARWAKVITDGFGNMNCYAARSLAGFGDFLYAGLSIWDPDAQAYSPGEIWRCSAASGCDEASDWEQVVSDGFGNAQNYGVSNLHEFGDHLYAVTTNSETGLEVWRTANGTDWEQVGFAGFGDSNNSAPYWDNSVAVFDNCLYIGTTNSANGGEVWQKSVVTAGFTASPTEGVPPLTVTFTNTSTGDYTSSLWGFGDDITSTLTSPTHIYTAAGVYTVTLTVSDGIDTSTITRPNYITVRYSVYLPLILRNK